ncbi:YhfG family protein [Pantoea sp. ARC607]|uniref:YhfG family protein n=1 Tax=unclassified Pantoea TaxID=2630326 RepID=UPI000DA7EF19|nr:YhfG family protein [Pantoea sp. ARC607]PZL95561.1 DUF2559 domain-containing protein [Pantoea sp. ARC607]
MANRLTEKQKVTLWQQRRSASYQASCRLEGFAPTETSVNSDDAAARLASLRRQYGL